MIVLEALLFGAAVAVLTDADNATFAFDARFAAGAVMGLLVL